MNYLNTQKNGWYTIIIQAKDYRGFYESELDLVLTLSTSSAGVVTIVEDEDDDDSPSSTISDIQLLSIAVISGATVALVVLITALIVSKRAISKVENTIQDKLSKIKIGKDKIKK